MAYYKRLITFSIFLTLFISCKGQSTDILLIRSFLNDVLANSGYNENEIANKYVTFFSPPSDSLSEEKLNSRHLYLHRNLKQIYDKYSKLYHSAATPIVRYKDLSADKKVPFDREILKNVYGVIFSKDKIMYVWLRNGKIASFDLYMQKGVGRNASAYFITY